MRLNNNELYSTLRKACAKELRMKTVKEYAEMKGVSHQAVYKMLQVHKDELEDYIIKRGRTRFLTDDAIAILEKYRESNPVIVDQVHSRERIEELENTIKQMLVRENELQREIAANNKELREMAELRATQAKLIAEAEANVFLLEERTEELEQTRRENANLKAQLSMAEEEKEQIQEQLHLEKNKTWLQKLFRK